MQAMMTPRPTHIPQPAQFFLETGLLFEINRAVLHPIGLSLLVQKTDMGMELGLLDHRDNPTITFDPVTYQKGRTKWKQYWQTKGQKTHQRRERLLGFTVQQEGDVRLQAAKRQQG